MILLVPFAIIAIYLIAFSTNEAIKKYLFLSLIIILPLSNNFFLPVKYEFITLTTQRVLLLPIIFLLPLIFRNQKKILITNFFYSILLFALYYLLRGALFGKLPKTMFLETGFFLIAFFVIDNLHYNENDRKILPWYFAFLTLFSAFVSYKQITGDGQYYRGPALEIRKDVIINAFADTTRNPSIFGLFSDGMLFIGLLSIIFIFLFYKKKKIIYFILFLISFFTAFITFDRSALIAPLIGLIDYIFISIKKRVTLIIAVSVTLLVVLSVSFLFVNTFKDTPLYQERILSESYKERLNTLDIFFNHLIEKKILFGFGSEQHPETFIKYGRIGGTLNGFIAVYVYGGLFGLILYLNMLRILFLKIKVYSRANQDYEFYIFPISFILYNFTLSAAYFILWPSFLIFYMYFRINEQLGVLHS